MMNLFSVYDLCILDDLFYVDYSVFMWWLGEFGIWEIEQIDTIFHVSKLFWTNILMKEYQFQ